MLASAVPTPTGFRVIHARAVPDDNLASWLAFFLSLPGQPKAILADRWSDLIKAAEIVWPGVEVRASTWHTYDLLRRRSNKARMYPGTHELVDEAEVSFADAELFRAWRIRAEAEAPPSVKKFLKPKAMLSSSGSKGRDPTRQGPSSAFSRRSARRSRPAMGASRTSPEPTSAWPSSPRASTARTRSAATPIP
jgi:hypothetical protein